jgi:hypothetical protein
MYFSNFRQITTNELKIEIKYKRYSILRSRKHTMHHSPQKLYNIRKRDNAPLNNKEGGHAIIIQAWGMIFLH